MVDVSLVSEAAWCEARRQAEVIRPLAERAHRPRHLVQAAAATLGLSEGEHAKTNAPDRPLRPPCIRPADQLLSYRVVIKAHRIFFNFKPKLRLHAGFFRDLMPSLINHEREGDAEMIMHTIRYLFGASLIAALAVMASVGADAALTLSTIYSFPGGSDGAGPGGGLISDGRGALYGIAGNTVFMMTPPATIGSAWTENVLYNFCSQINCSDGASPFSSPIMDASGALYGTTAEGGAYGFGTVFKLTPPISAGDKWTYNVLYSFEGQYADGSSPSSGLILDPHSGALYGTTFEGGSVGFGVVFRLMPPAVSGGNWTESVLYNFTDSRASTGTLLMDASGALYDTSSNIAFKLTPPNTTGGTWSENTLYTFCPLGGNCSNGLYPGGSLIMDRSGALYGVTSEGGNLSCNEGDGCGIVFKLTPPSVPSTAWTEDVLYRFCSLANCSDGIFPSSGLIADSNGNLFGTTRDGGAYGYGTVFEVTSSGFVPPPKPVTFAGTPGQANCIGKSVSALTQQYGGLAHAAAALDYSGVSDLQNAVATYCGG